MSGNKLFPIFFARPLDPIAKILVPKSETCSFSLRALILALKVLPDELLLSILDWIPIRKRTVYHDALKNWPPFFSRHNIFLDLSLTYHVLIMESFHFKLSPFVKSLTISPNFYYPSLPAFFIESFSTFQYLQSLQLANLPCLTNDDIQILLKWTPRLLHLSLTSFLVIPGWDFESIAPILLKLVSLRTLSLRYSKDKLTFISTQELTDWIVKFKSLELMDLRNCRGTSRLNQSDFFFPVLTGFI